MNMPNRMTQEEKLRGTCRFFGPENAKHECGAGIVFKFEDGGIPCLSWHNSTAVCSKRASFTEEEVKEKLVQRAKVVNDFLIANRSAHDAAKVQGYGKGHGGYGEIDCPVCKTGKLAFKVSAYNGHLWGQCKTDGCVSWME